MPVTHGGDIFEAAEKLGCDWRDILDFSANINPLGTAPGVREAITAAMDEIVHYPDPYSSRLQRALAQEWNVEPDCILTGNGATELIHFVAQVWRQPVSIVVPAFSEFHRVFPKASLRSTTSEWPEAGLLVITNPMNPTGEAIEFPTRRGLTLVDESFIEFTDLPTSIGQALVLRSLTKFHAIPGLRVGALIGPAELMQQWKAFRAPWQVNTLGQAAALAALNDKEHQQATRDFIREERDRLLGFELPRVNIKPSCANYLFVELDYNADQLCSYFLEHRILIRNCTNWPGIPGQAVRVAIRTREENDKLFDLWRTFTCD